MATLKRGWSGWLLGGALVLSAGWWHEGFAAEPFPPMRAIWVSRFDFRTADDVRDILKTCSELHFNTVFLQVRGNGTVLYDSSIEPPATCGIPGVRQEPQPYGFDALDVAVKEAKELGLSLHAWINVSPAWMGTLRPRDPRQVRNAHPEWMLFDRQGKAQPLVASYVGLNPCLPEVRAYLGSIAAEVAGKYPVDGLHLDYLGMIPQANTDYSYDLRTLELFKQASGGHTPDSAPGEWDAWRVQQTTEVVAEIRKSALHARSGIAISAALFPSVEANLKVRRVDPVALCNQRLLDFVVPMIYTPDLQAFASRMALFHEMAGEVPMVVGMALNYQNSPAEAISQMAEATRKAQGFAAYGCMVLSDAASKWAQKPRTPEDTALWRDRLGPAIDELAERYGEIRSDTAPALSLIHI